MRNKQSFPNLVLQLRSGLGRSALGLLTATLLGPVNTQAEFDVSSFEPTVERALADWQVPGAAIAVIENGNTVFAAAYGLSSIQEQEEGLKAHRGTAGDRVTAQTYFINASTTKAMLAAGVLILVDEGKLDLDAPVIDYLPELHFGDPTLTAQLSLRDLLTHRTGLPSTDFWTFNQGMTLAEQLPRLRSVRPVAPPRSRKIYQNTMYEIAGLVIQRVSGEPWEQFLKERLWQPIGMDTVATRAALPRNSSRAQPYELIDGKVRRVNHSLRPQVSDAAGSAWSTLDDMILWAQFLLRDGITKDGRRLLSQKAMETMFRPQQLIDPKHYYPTASLTHPNWISYGLGWYQQDFQGQKIDYHTGSLNGAVAMLGLDRARGLAIVVMANLGGAELRHALLWSVMDSRVGTDRPDWHSEVLALYQAREDKRSAWRSEVKAGRLDVPPSLPLSAYSGDFDSPRGGPLKISAGDKHLSLATMARNYRLTPWHAETFLIEHEDWKHGSYARFLLTPLGTIEAIEVFGMRFDRRQALDPGR